MDSGRIGRVFHTTCNLNWLPASSKGGSLVPDKGLQHIRILPGQGITPFRSKSKPLKSLGVVLRHALPAKIHDSQVSCRFRVACIGGLGKQTNRSIVIKNRFPPKIMLLGQFPFLLRACERCGVGRWRQGRWRGRNGWRRWRRRVNGCRRLGGSNRCLVGRRQGRGKARGSRGLDSRWTRRRRRRRNASDGRRNRRRRGKLVRLSG